MNHLSDDLDHILSHTNGLWDEIRGKRLFITGGTGFFGSWLLESFAWANNALDLNASVVVLTRNIDAFQKRAPHLAANPAITFHMGDVRDFDFPEGEFSHIIHAATTSAVATFNNLEDPLMKFDTIMGGTRRVLDLAVRCHAAKFLLTSSGVVYGKQPVDVTHMSEDHCGAPDPVNPVSVVGESKRAAELLCTLYSQQYGLETKIARCFSFVGPYLQIDIHYAIGNFIRDVLNGGPIIINGDGRPHRAFMYASDLTVWLWTILFKGESCVPYNVGSDKGVTIAELAAIVSQAAGCQVEVVIKGAADSEKPADRYVPSIERAKNRLGLSPKIELRDAVERTVAYYRYLSANQKAGVQNS
jgi:nucleoside-diphosphate-sugar epimerase